MTSTTRPRVTLFSIILVVLLAAGLSLIKATQSDTKGLTPAVKSEVESRNSPLPGVVAKDRLDSVAEEEIELTIADLCVAREQADNTDAETLSADEINRSVAALKALVQEVQEPLLASTDPEHLIFAAILEYDPVARLELLSRAMKTGIDDPVVLWNTINLCSDRSLNMVCGERSWEDRLLDIDGQNSEAWIRVAANRLLAGDEVGALQAVQQAAVAPETRTYWPESIALVERALAATGNSSFVERAGYAFGIATSALPDYGAYTDMCKKQSAMSKDWAYACLQYGELIERQSKTILGHAISFAIQRLALESLGDEAKLANVLSRAETARKIRKTSFSGEDALSQALMTTNPALFHAYLTAIKRDGEAGARAYLRAETERWIAKYEDMECIP